MQNPASYKNLEQRMYTSYLLQSPNEFSGRAENGTGGSEWLSLYNWTRGAYGIFAENPELLAPRLHEDTVFPSTYAAEKNGRPKLKSEMRGALKVLNGLLEAVWEAVRAGTIEGDALVLPSGYSISKKYIAQLARTGIEIADGRMYASAYKGMFSALKELTLQTDGFHPPWGKFAEGVFAPGASVYANGFRRFVRCAYDERAESMNGVFRRLSGDETAFDTLTKWLSANGYKYAVDFDAGGVRNMEASAVVFMKSLDGSAPDGGFNIYNHTHIGIRAEFRTLENPPQKFFLSIQKPREALAAFNELPPVVQSFIAKYHAKCNNCGYCNQRSGGKSRQFTICAEHNGESYRFCPVNHVYTYCWSKLSGELAEGLTAYLDWLEQMLSNFS